MTGANTFQVVPLAEASPHGVGQEHVAHRPVVLVVDDETLIADTLSLILCRHGFSVLTAYGAADALDVASIIPPELLVSDVAMPGMNGVDLAISLVSTIPDCKVLLFSGQAATTNLLAVAQECGHQFTLLTKPVHPTDILRHIRRLQGEELAVA